MEGNNQKLELLTPTTLRLLKFILPSVGLGALMMSLLFSMSSREETTIHDQPLQTYTKNELDKIIRLHELNSPKPQAVTKIKEEINSLKLTDLLPKFEPTPLPRALITSPPPEDIDEQMLSWSNTIASNTPSTEPADEDELPVASAAINPQVQLEQLAMQAPTRVQFNQTTTGSGSLELRPSQGQTNALSAYQKLAEVNHANPYEIETARSALCLNQGSVIPAVLLNAINSDIPGQLTSQVTTNVYDSVSGEHLLIPQGTKLIGQYSSEVKLGQERLMVAFNRLIFPDGNSLTLNAMPGANEQGFAGFDAHVDNHFVKNTYNGLIVALFNTGQKITSAQSGDDFASISADESNSVVGENLKSSFAQNIKLAPTLTVPFGTRFNLSVTADLFFKKDYQYD